jgi:polysaccharide export outer membrane protein
MKNKRIASFALAMAFLATPLAAQTPTAQPGGTTQTPRVNPGMPLPEMDSSSATQTPAPDAPAANLPTVAVTGRRLTNYTLGPGDEIVIMSVQAPEIANKPIRITSSGEFTVPMVGRVKAAGKTVQQLENEMVDRLKEYIKEPDVAINITQIRSQPVSVFGAVGKPGIHQLDGTKTLVEVLALAGGVRPDGGSRVKITRKLDQGRIPLASASVNGEYSTADVNVRSIENATHPEENIEILPDDVITVPRAELIYVMGEGVKQPGAFTLSDREGISVIEAFARAQGQAPAAGLKNARVIRPVPGASRVEMAVNLDDILKGKSKDLVLKPDDILYVPRSEIKGTARRTIDTIVSMATGLIIYRGF